MRVRELSVLRIVLLLVYGLVNRSRDESVDTLPVGLGVRLNLCLLSAGNGQIDSVIILLDVLVDGLLLVFTDWRHKLYLST